MKDQIKQLVLEELNEYTVGQHDDIVLIEGEDLEFIAEAIATKVKELTDEYPNSDQL